MKWLRDIKYAQGAKCHLILFPYGGGGASTYYPWKEFIPDTVNLISTQLPGREDRFRETPISDITQISQAIGQEILRLHKANPLPIYLFGHSLGAIIALETSHQLRLQSLLPAALIVSGRQAPGLPPRFPPASHLPNDQFIARVKALNGTPMEVFEHLELIELLTPALKADFRISEEYLTFTHDPLTIPIFAFGADEDLWVDPKELIKWQSVTKGAFQSKIFNGDHFYIKNNPDEMLKSLMRILPS